MRGETIELWVLERCMVGRSLTTDSGRLLGSSWRKGRVERVADRGRE
jgi:hypothetical protein